MKFEVTQDYNVITGSERFGFLTTTYNVLVELFGEPIKRHWEIDVEWYIKFEDGTIATIYNYRNGKNYLGKKGKAVEDIMHWNIGGFNSSAVRLVHNTIKEHIAKYEFNVGDKFINLDDENNHVRRTEHEIVNRTIDEKTGEPVYTTYGYQYKIFNFKESYLHDNYTMNIKKDYYIVTIQMEKFNQSFSQTKSHVIATSPIDFFMNERMLYQDEYNVSLLGYYIITRQQYDKANKHTEIYTKEVKERLRKIAKKMRDENE